MSDAEDTVDVDKWPTAIVVEVIETLDAELQRRYDEAMSLSLGKASRKFH